MEYVTNLGQEKEKKLITITSLTKSNHCIIGGMCYLTRNEIEDVIGDCKRELYMRKQKYLNKK